MTWPRRWRSTGPTRPRPIVIASDGEARFAAALHVITVPETHPQLGFVLAAMAGHLFGYEAALAIDAQARPLREARAAIEDAVGDSVATDGDDLLALAAARPHCGRPAVLRRPAQPCLRRPPRGEHRGAAGLVVPLRVGHRAARGLPSRARQASARRPSWSTTSPPRSPSGIEELTRPVDAIKHQAKTVTVGISRSDETLLQPALVQAVLAAGTSRDRLTYKTLRTLADLDPAVAEVTGWIRYELDGDAEDGEVPMSVVDRGGIALDIPSRAERAGVLRGTKHTRGPRAAGVRHPGPGRRPHRRDRAGDEGRPRHRPHVAARAVPRPRGRGHRARAPCRGTATVGRPSAMRCSRPSRRSGRICSPRVPTADLLVAAAGRAGQPLAYHVAGRQRDRHRRRPLRDRAHARGIRAHTRRCARGCSPSDERAYCDLRADPTERYAARFAAKEAVLKAMGVGVGACKWTRDRSGAGRGRRALACRLHGGAVRLAEERGIGSWLLTMTHTSHTAEAIAVALGPHDPDRHARRDGGDRRGRARTGRRY